MELHPQFLAAAERKYAIALGRYEVAGHATEKVVGAEMRANAAAKVEAEKRKLLAEMTRIAGNIRRVCGPHWTPDHIKPVRPRSRSRRQGDLSISAYKVLRHATEPMTSSAVAKLVATDLGMADPHAIDLAKITSAIHTAFSQRAKEGTLIRHPTRPFTWSVIPLAERKRQAAS